MPYVPSGILYFSVWKYSLYGLLLIIPTLVFRSYGIFEQYPVGGVVYILSLFIIVMAWFEYGDAKLFRQWKIDKERSNCDRLAKAFLYAFCCALWPRFVFKPAG